MCGLEGNRGDYLRMINWVGTVQTGRLVCKAWASRCSNKYQYSFVTYIYTSHPSALSLAHYILPYFTSFMCKERVEIRLVLIWEMVVHLRPDHL